MWFPSQTGVTVTRVGGVCHGGLSPQGLRLPGHQPPGVRLSQVLLFRRDSSGALVFLPAPRARYCHCGRALDTEGPGGRGYTEGPELHSRPRCHPRPGPLNPGWLLQDASVQIVSCCTMRPLSLKASRTAAVQLCGGSSSPAVSRAGLKASRPQPRPRVLAQRGGLTHFTAVQSPFLDATKCHCCAGYRGRGSEQSGRGPFSCGPH